MKCPNCGAESHSKFCPDCGTPLLQPEPQPEPQPVDAIETADDIEPDGAITEKLTPAMRERQQTAQSVQTVPLFRMAQPMRPTQPQNPYNYPQQQNPYNPQQAAQPQNPYHQPQQARQPMILTPPQLPPDSPFRNAPNPFPAPVTAPPRRRRTGIPVAAIIVAAVVLTGILIAVGSGIFYHKGLVSAVTEQSSRTAVTEPPYDYRTDPDPDYYFIQQNRTGEPFDFDYGTVTLSSVKNESGDYTFTGVLENTSGETQTYSLDDLRIALNDAPDFTIQLDKKTLGGETYDAGTDFELKAGEKKEFTFAASGPKESSPVRFTIYVNFYNTDGVLSSAEVYYELPKSEIK